MEFGDDYIERVLYGLLNTFIPLLRNKCSLFIYMPHRAFYKAVVSTSQRTQCAAITKTNVLLL